MNLICPSCERAILSRRNKRCSFCQEPLPDELLFTPAQVEAIEFAERERKRLSDLRDAERAKAVKQRSMGDFGGGNGI